MRVGNLKKYNRKRGSAGCLSGGSPPRVARAKDLCFRHPIVSQSVANSGRADQDERLWQRALPIGPGASRAPN